MSFLSRRLPGGIFPRLVALFPLIFPLYLVRGVFFGLPVTLPEVFLGAMLFFFLFEHEPFRVSTWKLTPVLLFLIAAFVGVMVVPELAYWADGTEFPTQIKALGILKGWILAPFVYFVIARNVLREKPSLIPLAFKSMFVGGTVLAVLALMQVFTGEFITPDGRASGPFESANYLSLYLGPLFVYGFFAFFETKGQKEKFALVLGTLLIGLALFFSFSYAAWLALAATLAFGILIQVRRREPRLFKWAFGGLFLMGLLLVASQVGTEKFQQFFEFSSQSSTSVRVQVYTIALSLIQDHPLFGIGLGQFEQQYQAVAVQVLGVQPFEAVMLHPHNLYLSLWLSTGLLGLVAFVWLCIKALPWLFEEDSKHRPIAALMLVVILLHGLFDTPYFKNDLAFQFWLLLAVLI